MREGGEAMTWSHKLSDINQQLKDLLTMSETQDVQNKHELNQEVCRWKLVSQMKLIHTTSCGVGVYIDGGPSAHDYIYCPYCGRKIEEVVE